MDLGAALTTGTSITAIAGTAYGLWRGATAWYRRTLGSRRAWAKNLNTLACGVTRPYAEAVLGPPTFHRPLRPGRHEYVYATPHALVQLLTDQTDDIARIAITVTDPRFKFDTAGLTFNHLNFTLARDPFNKAPSPDGWWVWIGASRYGYAESYYFGNPGGYQNYALAHNQAGPTGDLDFASLHQEGVTAHASGTLASLEEHPSGEPFEPTSPRGSNFRAHSRPNTIVIARPLIGHDLLAQTPLGAELNHVRVLPRYQWHRSRPSRGWQAVRSRLRLRPSG